MSTYTEPILPSRSILEKIFGPSQATLDFEKMEKEAHMREHLESLWTNMEEIRANIMSQLRNAEEMNLRVLQGVISDFSPDHRVQIETDRKREIIEKCENMIYPYFDKIEIQMEQLTEAVKKYNEMQKKVASEQIIAQRSTMYYEKLIESEAPDRIKRMKEPYEKLKTRVDIEESENAEKERIQQEKIRNTPNPSNLNPREKQTYVPEGKQKTNTKQKTNPKSSTSGPKKTISKKSTTKLVPNKYFRDTVFKYTGETMTSPVASKDEIKKMYRKVSLHIHAGSTNYQKLSSAEKKEADEIFKKINEEKEKYVPKSGKKKHKKPKKKKQTKKKEKSFFKKLFSNK